MRRLALALAVLCAILSGWMPALAQLPGHAAGAHSHHGDPAALPAAQHAGHGSNLSHAPQPGSCGHDCAGHRAIHPLLCAACFAIETEEAVPTLPLALKPAFTREQAAALVARDPAPRVPPPKPGALS
ncbi:hypothetical protein ACLE20_01840 [Rhizobium sp. YIM 134829]|uniref:hypothetical protein n=1 Tax=Rhizobium sp. YIM 134829 TaxID=3390453 RepID=UPI00397B7186